MTINYTLVGKIYSFDDDLNRTMVKNVMLLMRTHISSFE